MSAATRAWVVAASVGAVEVLKDHGICRWNYPLRCLQQQAKSNIRSYSQAKKLSAQSSSAISNKEKTHEKLKQSEESLRKIMYLSCWGPN